MILEYLIRLFLCMACSELRTEHFAKHILENSKARAPGCSRGVLCLNDSTFNASSSRSLATAWGCQDGFFSPREQACDELGYIRCRETPRDKHPLGRFIPRHPNTMRTVLVLFFCVASAAAFGFGGGGGGCGCGAPPPPPCPPPPPPSPCGCGRKKRATAVKVYTHESISCTSEDLRAAIENVWVSKCPHLQNIQETASKSRLAVFSALQAHKGDYTVLCSTDKAALPFVTTASEFCSSSIGPVTCYVFQV